MLISLGHKSKDKLEISKDKRKCCSLPLLEQFPLTINFQNQAKQLAPHYQIVYTYHLMVQLALSLKIVGNIWECLLRLIAILLYFKLRKDDL